MSAAALSFRQLDAAGGEWVAVPNTGTDALGRRTAALRCPLCSTPGCWISAALEGDDIVALVGSHLEDKLFTVFGYIAAASDGKAAAKPATAITFASPAERRAHRPDAVPWLWEGYVARGACTLLAGKPKSGKSTTAAAFAEAVASGARQFLGRAIADGPVVYVIEEGDDTALEKLRHDRLRLLTRNMAWPKPAWAELVGAATAEALRVDAPLIVIDTFAAWNGLGADAEKDAGAVQAAVAPLDYALQNDIAVVLVHHQRKAGGEGGDAVRGSSALTAAVDCILEYERLPEGAPRRQRQLVAVSRWSQTPPLLVVEFDPASASWRVIGEGEGRDDSATVGHRDAVLQALPPVPPGVTLDEIGEAVSGKKSDWHGELKALISEGLVKREGVGKKGDPFLHWRPSDSVPGFRSHAGTESAGEGDSNSVPAPPPPVGGRGNGIESDGSILPAGNGKPVDWQAEVERLAEKFPDLGESRDG